MFSRIWTKKSTENYSEGIGKLAEAVKEADAVVIGAGSGLSASAGLTYSWERFEKYYSEIPYPGYVFRRVLSLPCSGGILGMVEQAYLL